MQSDNSPVIRGESRTVGTSRMEHFVIIVNSWKPLTIITKNSVLDFAAALDTPLVVNVATQNSLIFINKISLEMVNP